jgi:hypothetical protein
MHAYLCTYVFTVPLVVPATSKTAAAAAATATATASNCNHKCKATSTKPRKAPLSVWALSRSGSPRTWQNVTYIHTFHQSRFLPASADRSTLQLYVSRYSVPPFPLPHLHPSPNTPSVPQLNNTHSLHPTRVHLSPWVYSSSSSSSSCCCLR